jgi:hypothetical protein
LGVYVPCEDGFDWPQVESARLEIPDVEKMLKGAIEFKTMQDADNEGVEGIVEAETVEDEDVEITKEAEIVEDE